MEDRNREYAIEEIKALRLAQTEYGKHTEKMQILFVVGVGFVYYFYFQNTKEWLILTGTVFVAISCQLSYLYANYMMDLIGDYLTQKEAEIGYEGWGKFYERNHKPNREVLYIIIAVFIVVDVLILGVNTYLVHR